MSPATALPSSLLAIVAGFGLTVAPGPVLPWVGAVLLSDPGEGGRR